jgi:hypothetical protein
VAYRLELPVDSKVYPVFHVSQLKRAQHRPIHVKKSLPDMSMLMQVPEQVLEFRWCKTANKITRQGLVGWGADGPVAPTWENLEDLHRRFPAAPAWVPERALDFRWSAQATGGRRQALVVWNFSNPDKATWEDLEQLQQRYPATSAWGQAEFQGGGGGIVSNLPSATPEEEARKPTRSPRRRKANPRYAGPDWVGPVKATT